MHPSSSASSNPGTRIKHPHKSSSPEIFHNAEYFRGLIEGMEDFAIFTLNPAGKITSWNSGAKLILGYDEQEVLGQDLVIFFKPEDVALGVPQQELAEGALNGVARLEGWRRRQDGRFIWARSKIFAIHDSHGNLIGYTKIMRDMTAQRELASQHDKLAGALDLHRSQLLNLFMQAPAMIAIIEGAEHRIAMANEQYLQMLGRGNEIIGKTVAEVLPEVVEQGFIALLDGVYATGKPYVGNETPVEFKVAGETEPRKIYLNFVYQPSVATDGYSPAIFVHAVDVTAQVESRQKTEEAQRRLTIAQDAGEMGSYEIDLQTNKLIGSPKMAEIMGLSLEELEEAFIQQESRIHPDDVPRIRDALQRSQKSHSAYNIEYRIKWPTGGWHWILTRGQYQYDDEAKPVSLSGVVMDITERKQLERQKDDFVGIASHELRTPVTSLKAYAQVMQRRFEKSGDRENASKMTKINIQLDKLTALVGDLLDVSKADAGSLIIHPSPFKFDDLVREVVESVQLTSDRHHIQIKGSTGQTVSSDRDRLGQVLINLLGNAIKYSPDAPIITVETEASYDSVKCCIRDQGIGIAPEKQEQIFERFFRVSGPNMESYPGLGLGLYISSEIIKRLNGRIWVESTNAQGSTFCFTIPLDETGEVQSEE